MDLTKFSFKNLLLSFKKALINIVSCCVLILTLVWVYGDRNTGYEIGRFLHNQLHDC